MKILAVHPVMSFLGGGERLCCETIRALLSLGHEITLLSESFDQAFLERFFGYEGLFKRITLVSYPPTGSNANYGKTEHLIRHIRGQKRVLRKLKLSAGRDYDLVFSTQDPGYFPDVRVPVVQWGYFPRFFPNYSLTSWAKALRTWPLRSYYRAKISRIGLVLAISQYSQFYLDREWKRPSTLVYPPCNMIESGTKRDLVVTVGRAIPQKRLELFWMIAKTRPKYEFVMLLTQDPYSPEYALSLVKATPPNGRILVNSHRPEYQKVLGEAKVYLHLMLNEPFGITIAEAMSASCVPIVHDSGGAREIVNLDSGSRWRTIQDVPDMLDKAMQESPSASASQRAEKFNYAEFEKRVSSIFAERPAGSLRPNRQPSQS